MRQLTLTFLGKRWTIRWVARLGRKIGKGLRTIGDCDPPDAPHKTIRVQAGMSADVEREVLIHELTHAAFFHMDEDSVRAFAANLNAALTKCGFPPVRS